jgi:hypothetical protein
LQQGPNEAVAVKREKNQFELQIQTLNKESASDSIVLSGLSVRNIDGENELQLPKVYVQDEIPVDKEDVPTQQDIHQWGYLKQVNIENIDADIGLLIGANVPKASEPCQVIKSQGDGPYACKTRFGWAVYGLIKKKQQSTKGHSTQNSSGRT